MKLTKVEEAAMSKQLALTGLAPAVFFFKNYFLPRLTPTASTWSGWYLAAKFIVAQRMLRAL